MHEAAAGYGFNIVQGRLGELFDLARTEGDEATLESLGTDTDALERDGLRRETAVQRQGGLPHRAELAQQVRALTVHNGFLYAGAGVKEFWLVLGPEKQIEVHRQPQGEQFAEHVQQLASLQGELGERGCLTHPNMFRLLKTDCC